jgi:hypothetical protein
MTLLDIPLSPATVMIAAVALGIVVDDTVHLMTAFERSVRSTGKVRAAIKSTLLEVGQPVMVTSVLLVAGFATLILGSFLPTRQVGCRADSGGGADNGSCIPAGDSASATRQTDHQVPGSQRPFVIRDNCPLPGIASRLIAMNLIHASYEGCFRVS